MSGTEPNRRCEECFYFDKKPTTHSDGYCYRLPPTGRFEFPAVNYYHYCGEWKDSKWADKRDGIPSWYDMPSGMMISVPRGVDWREYWRAVHRLKGEVFNK